MRSLSLQGFGLYERFADPASLGWSKVSYVAYGAWHCLRYYILQEAMFGGDGG